ncbi:MAG: hypothetical protein ACREQP_21660 [Candidatus Binatia bacterium]
MRLWGKVARGMAFFIAAICALAAIFLPGSRLEALTAAVILVALALFGIPALLRLFSSFTGDEEVLESGIAGSATIASLKETWLRFNDCPVVQFSLSVEAGGAAYPVDIKQAVEPELLERLSPGSVVAVRVDRENHKKVVIDWQEPTRVADETAVGLSSEKEPAETPRESGRSGVRSLWPFLRWGFLLFGLVFLRLSCEEGYFEKGGVAAQGIVLKKTYTPGTSSVGGSGTGSPSRHTVSYRFTTKDGRTVEGRYDVLPGTWQSLQDGGPVVIEYLSEAPGTNRIPDQRARSGTWRIMALVLLVASAVLFIIVRRQRLRPSG